MGDLGPPSWVGLDGGTATPGEPWSGTTAGSAAGSTGVWAAWRGELQGVPGTAALLSSGDLEGSLAGTALRAGVAMASFLLPLRRRFTTILA
ncbi:hypothetical protein MTO96_047058 [Rhipicephalus appendiculatus]